MASSPASDDISVVTYLDSLERLLRESTAEGFVRSGVSLAIAQILERSDHVLLATAWELFTEAPRNADCGEQVSAGSQVTLRVTKRQETSTLHQLSIRDFQRQTEC